MKRFLPSFEYCFVLHFNCSLKSVHYFGDSFSSSVAYGIWELWLSKHYSGWHSCHLIWKSLASVGPFLGTARGPWGERPLWLLGCFPLLWSYLTPSSSLNKSVGVWGHQHPLLLPSRLASLVPACHWAPLRVLPFLFQFYIFKLIQRMGKLFLKLRFAKVVIRSNEGGQRT